MTPAASALSTALALLAMIDGCGNIEGPGSSIANHTYPGLPDGVPSTTQELTATRVGNQLHLATWGSSSCPVYPTDIRAHSPHDVTVELRTAADDLPDDVACTADMAATTHVITLPARTTLTGPLTVTIADPDGDTQASLKIEP